MYYDADHEYFRLLALGFFIIAITTDALDGSIARSFKQQTELGSFLDPFADKLLLLTGFLGIHFSKAFFIKPPAWIVIVIVFRDLFILFGLIIIFVTTKHIRIHPNFLGKCTTVSQMLTILSLLMSFNHAEFIWLITAFLTIASTAAYLLRGIKLLNSHPH